EGTIEHLHQIDPDTRLEPKGNKKSPKVEINTTKQPVNVIKEEEESTEDDYKLRRREKGKHVEEAHNGKTTESMDVAKMITDAIQQEHENLQAEISSQINNAIANHIPSQLQQDDLPIWLTLKYKYKKLHVSDTPCRPSVVRPRDQVDPHDDAYLKGENSEKRQKTTDHKTYVFGESSSGQVNESEPCPSMLGNQEQLYDIDF
nr:hypothetical protein [Tanacetum cinerariifolium]